MNIMVVHDWGSILGFDYAVKHANRVKTIAFMEAAVYAPPAQPPYGPPKPLIATKNSGVTKADFFKLLQQIKTPEMGEKL
jgi:pimeloyl-ACP methyl ester carboxylesterase